MRNADDIGARGEALALVHLTTFCRDGDRPYFRVHFLGEKCETLDFLVELMDTGDVTPYFFAQVKTTTLPLQKKKPRLVVNVSEKDILRMLGFPAPTYVIGVALGREKAFVVSIHGQPGEAISSLSTEHELNCETLKWLWDEVLAFWQARDMTRTTSRFLN